MFGIGELLTCYYSLPGGGMWGTFFAWFAAGIGIGVAKCCAGTGAKAAFITFVSLIQLNRTEKYTEKFSLACQFSVVLEPPSLDLSFRVMDILSTGMVTFVRQ